MKAEILATGDELVYGKIIDANSAYIAQKLEALGVEVIRHSCVGDDLAELVSILTEIGKRADIAIVTGGLGPTSDDLTTEAAAQAAQVSLALDAPSLAAIKAFFAARHYPMAPGNEKQALFPQGATILPNSHGTAPGFAITIGQCAFFCLPGVPSEMINMFQTQAAPLIQSRYAAQLSPRRHIQFSTFGATESQINNKIAGLTSLFPGIKPGFCVRFPEIQVTLVHSGVQPASPPDDELTQAAHWTRAQLGDLIFAEDGSRMEAAVGRLLLAQGRTLAAAESCTGGRIADLLTDVPGISASFLFSGVTYSNAAKIQVLGVSGETLEKFGAVHEETVKEMAIGAKRLSGADYGLATSGIAGPDGGTETKPVGTVCIGLAFKDQVEARRYFFPFRDRWMNKTIFAISALNWLRRKLISG